MSIAMSPGERLAKIVKSLKRSPNVSVGASKKGFGSSDRSKGCIVNTASLSGLGAGWGICVHDASKGAVVNPRSEISLRTRRSTN